MASIPIASGGADTSVVHIQADADDVQNKRHLIKSRRLQHISTRRQRPWRDQKTTDLFFAAYGASTYTILYRNPTRAL